MTTSTAKPILMSHSRLRVDEDPVESEDKVGMKKLLSAWTWIKNLQQSIIEDEGFNSNGRKEMSFLPRGGGTVGWLWPWYINPIESKGLKALTFDE